MRASFEMPKTSLFGMYAMAICEQGGGDAVSGPNGRNREGGGVGKVARAIEGKQHGDEPCP